MRNLLLVFFVLYSFKVHLQYAKAIVNKGEVTVNNTFVFKPGQYFDIRPSQKITLSESSIITCKKSKKIMVYSGAASISYSDIMEDIAVSSLVSDAYFDNMFSGNYVAEIVGYGSVDRGLDNENSPTYFYPEDSMLVLSDSVVLEVGNRKTSFLSDIKVVNPEGELVVMSTENLNYGLLKNLVPGDYNWSCDILVDDNEIEFHNYFKVPVQNEKEDMLGSIETFKSLISSLDDSTREFILESWLKHHDYYFLD